MSGLPVPQPQQQQQQQAPAQPQKHKTDIDAKKLLLLEREYNKAIQLANKFTGDYYQFWKVKITQILTTAQLIHYKLQTSLDFNVIVSRIRNNAVIREKKQQTEQAQYTNTQAKPNNTSFKCFRCGKPGHRIAECTVSIASHTNNKPRKTLYPDACIYCNRNNHKSEACYRKRKQQQPQMANMVAEAVAAVLAKINLTNKQEQANA